MSPPLNRLTKKQLSNLRSRRARRHRRDHQVAGGLGGLIAEVLGRKRPTPIEFVGLKDTFAESVSLWN